MSKSGRLPSLYLPGTGSDSLCAARITSIRDQAEDELRVSKTNSEGVDHSFTMIRVIGRWKILGIKRRYTLAPATLRISSSRSSHFRQQLPSPYYPFVTAIEGRAL